MTQVLEGWVGGMGLSSARIEFVGQKFDSGEKIYTMFGGVTDFGKVWHSEFRILLKTFTSVHVGNFAVTNITSLTILLQTEHKALYSQLFYSTHV